MFHICVGSYDLLPSLFSKINVANSPGASLSKVLVLLNLSRLPSHSVAVGTHQRAPSD